MDPNLFHLDWERTLEALVGIIVLAFLLERALAPLFESRWFIHTFVDRRVPCDREAPVEDRALHDGDADADGSGRASARARSRFPLRELLAFVFAAAVCWGLGFDALAIIFLQERVSFIGAVMTGAVVAGGSKASIKLFHDLLNVKSTAVREKQRLRDADRAGSVR